MAKAVQNQTQKNIKEDAKMAKVEKTLFEIANEMVVKATKETKIIGQELSTGISYFEGKNRLCKILKTKKGISLELNIVLPAEIEKEFGLTKITAAEAYKKHLGTMKYMARLADEKQLAKLIKSAVEEFTKTYHKTEEAEAVAK